ncbi:MAG: hypothetical protein ACE5KE_02650 [Methanosarcinales archaeon]
MTEALIKYHTLCDWYRRSDSDYEYRYHDVPSRGMGHISIDTIYSGGDTL